MQHSQLLAILVYKNFLHNYTYISLFKFNKKSNKYRIKKSK